MKHKHKHAHARTRTGKGAMEGQGTSVAMLAETIAKHCRSHPTTQKICAQIDVNLSTLALAVSSSLMTRAEPHAFACISAILASYNATTGRWPMLREWVTALWTMRNTNAGAPPPPWDHGRLEFEAALARMRCDIVLHPDMIAAFGGT